MGNHGVWADDEISCITINVLQLFIMHTTRYALNLASPKYYPNSVHKYIHTMTMLPCSHHAYNQYTGSREINVPGYVCLLERLKIGARLDNGLSSSISNLVTIKAAV